MGKKKAEAVPEPAIVQVEQADPKALELPVLELRVVARRHYREATQDVRDVYLLRVDGPAHSHLFCHLMCPLSQIRELVFLASVLGATETYDPPNNCMPGWEWPLPTTTGSTVPLQPAAPPAPSF